MTKSERGKRRLARQLLLCEAALTVAGFGIPEAWAMAKFFAPYLIPSAVGLFIGDAYFKNSSSRASNSVYPESGRSDSPECPDR